MNVQKCDVSTTIGQREKLDTEGAVNENPQSYYEIDPWRCKSVALGEIGREGE